MPGTGAFLPCGVPQRGFSNRRGRGELRPLSEPRSSGNVVDFGADDCVHSPRTLVGLPVMESAGRRASLGQETDLILGLAAHEKLKQTLSRIRSQCSALAQQESLEESPRARIQPIVTKPSSVARRGLTSPDFKRSPPNRPTRGRRSQTPGTSARGTSLTGPRRGSSEPPEVNGRSLCSGTGSPVGSDQATSRMEKPRFSGWNVCVASTRHPQRKAPRRCVKLLRSVFVGRPPVLCFDYYPAHLGEPRNQSRVLGDEELQVEGFTTLPKMFYHHSSSRDIHEYNAVVNTLRHVLYSTSLSGGKFSLLWGDVPTPDLIRGFNPYQKTNHFPSSWQVGRKDLLWKNVHRMKRQFPKHFDIMPTTYVLPEDSQVWAATREQHPSEIWIWKPTNSSCGRGIKVLSSNLSAAMEKSLAKRTGVVQRYVSRPLLLNGYKFDLRLYVVVTSFDPLKVYINSEGLVRLATERYSASTSTLRQRMMHLTNYSVNKHSKHFNMNLGRTTVADRPASSISTFSYRTDGEEEDGYMRDVLRDEVEEEEAQQNGTEGATSSSKWSLDELRDYFRVHGLDYDIMFSRIKDLVIKTMISVEEQILCTWHQGANFSGAPPTQIGPNQTCFEIYGFDVLLDEHLKPWLLEVNVLPSLSSSSPLDKRIKTRLIADVFTLVGFMPFECELVEKALKEERLHRLQGASPKPLKARSHTTQTLSSGVSLHDLGEAEWSLILETHDEYMRRGGLERIFPTRENVSCYADFFPTARYSNLVLARWLEAGGEQCFRSPCELPSWVPRQTCFELC